MLTWQTTPYLAELEKTYEASQYLDAKVTFVTERQIVKGWLNRYKLLLVPGTRNIPAEVFEKIRDYAAQGGRVLVVPESLLGDEYNHPADYLSKLGITIRETRRPKPGGLGTMAQGYDQSFSQSVTFGDDSPQKLSAAGTEGLGANRELEARGVRQTFDVKGNVLFRYSNNEPAIVRIPVGKGVIYYSGVMLEERSYGRLLDALLLEAKVTRPVRVRMLDGGDKWNIEARFAMAGNRKLLYVVNFNDRPVRLSINAPAGLFTSLLDLRDGHDVQEARITLPAHQTGIYEMF
jgi:beta-galactosidase GanA